MMIYVDELGNIIDNSKIDFSNINSIDFNLKHKYKSCNPALKIHFSDNSYKSTFHN